MTQLNEQQQIAVNATAKTVVIVAGAGAGKTRTAIERIIRQIESGVDARKIVVLTFTNAAAREITKRLSGVGNKVECRNCGRINDFSHPDCHNCGERFYENPKWATPTLGYCGTLHGFLLRLIQNDPSRVGLMSSVSVVTEEQAEKILDVAIKEMSYKGRKSDLKEALAVGEYATDRKRAKGAEIVALVYWNKLRESNLVDFDTILFHGLELLKNTKDLPYEHLVVDEAQDSGHVDFAIYKALSAHLKSVVYVGDPDQSIYGFRGAYVEGFLNLLKGEDTQVVKIEKNYRCDKIICESAQTLIEKNANRFDKKTISATDKEGLVCINHYPTDFAESLGIASRIEKNFGSGSNGFVDYNDVAVLVRTNALARKIADVLVANSIPVARKAMIELPPEWDKTLTFLSLLANPENEMLAHFWCEMKFGKKRADEMAFEALESYESLNTHFLKLSTPKIVDVPVFLVGEFMHPQAVERVMLAASTLDEQSTVTDLIVALGKDVEHRDEVGEGVTVTTYHSAKGREWDTVFLPAFEQGIVPINSAITAKNVDEERRLAYVAMTRAKRQLIISCADLRKPEFSFKPVPTEPSQFLPEANIWKSTNIH